MNEFKLPEIYSACAHPQSVWFEQHWRPIFNKLTAELEACRKERDHLNQMHQIAEHHFNQAADKLEEAVRALEFYGDGSKYQGSGHDPHHIPSAVQDAGYIARQTLEKLRK